MAAFLLFFYFGRSSYHAQNMRTALWFDVMLVVFYEFPQNSKIFSRRRIHPVSYAAKINEKFELFFENLWQLAEQQLGAASPIHKDKDL